ncbi:MAG: Ig-like domain-containing protein [Nitrospirota bacterium]
MKIFLFVSLLLGLTILFPVPNDLVSSGPEGSPPVVVSTVPESGAEGVDPLLSEIRVTFSREMLNKSWSWVQIAPENFPQITGGPRYLEDKKTCILDVRLEPGRTYIIWLNTQKFSNFKDLSGRPAQPYLLMFETRK